jgi:hypothetical protein
MGHSAGPDWRPGPVGLGGQAGLQKGEGRLREKASRQKRERERVSPFYFPFLLFQSQFKTLFKSNLNYFDFYTKPHITTNHMHQHVCTTMLLASYDEF